MNKFQQAAALFAGVIAGSSSQMRVERAFKAIFSHRFPRYGGDPYKTIARQIHTHYYECGAGSGDPNADSFGKLFP